MSTPTIVCLCGSTKFKDDFVEANQKETLAGRIVLSVGMFGHSGDPITPEQKIALDELHKRKIDLADEILVLNRDGYVGESTRSEINYAISHQKRVRYLEDPERRKAIVDSLLAQPEGTFEALDWDLPLYPRHQIICSIFRWRGLRFPSAELRREAAHRLAGAILREEVHFP